MKKYRPAMEAVREVVSAAFVLGIDCGNVIYRFRDQKPTSGYVYFLTSGARIVYIGATCRLANRLKGHRRTFKGKFDEAFYIRVRRSDMYPLESELIARVRPELNVRMATRAELVGDRLAAPVRPSPAVRTAGGTP